MNRECTNLQRSKCLGNEPRRPEMERAADRQWDAVGLHDSACHNEQHAWNTSRPWLMGSSPWMWTPRAALDPDSAVKLQASPPVTTSRP
jgi:hypothetical protein